ncbi:ribosome maturation factor RimP [Pigmentiphaga litoralis]|jgi:ribosome maturation factor RimP|uniref:ribosome maturation factor RimP n=1 Tax=Pigmentiphaga litoralis TaxID=516702 RepID=UPI0016737E3A|nr:ribosome maturation factor RimP [Pigmentiphaga litoralis]GGW99898.1 ribosome maturation factor RimP [Pigmentiphaga litoralis]
MADIFELTEQSLAGLGVELVDVERAGGGLLRVTIDRDEGVRIEDCEAVSKQLSRVFEVENIDYSRLEVGSPGTDRPLRRAKDFIRFAGERAEIKLRLPFNGRKVFTGTLVAPESVTGEGADAAAPNQEVQGAEVFGIEFEAKEGDIQVLNFTIDELERAKLDPVLNFRGKKQ